MNPSLSRPIATLALTALVAAGCPLPALAQSVSVTLNGQPLSVSPEPQERAGRIFVPLRGIFEQLGASVVYQNGTINAQGRGRRSISLHVGSTQALVNGQPQALDVAPFIIGASTFVPLRFISQALGAHVNYDGTNKIVAIDTSGMNVGGPPPDQQQQQPPPSQAMQPPPPAESAVRLGHLRPAEDAAVPGLHPTIEATFEGAPVDPNSLQISLDDTDITSQTSRSPSGFVFSPPSDLQPMRHTVRVRGIDRNGARFVRAWHFTTGATGIPQ
jgi:hypothetical protein